MTQNNHLSFPYRIHVDLCKRKDLVVFMKSFEWKLYIEEIHKTYHFPVAIFITVLNIL